MGGDVCALGAGAYPRRGRRGEAARSAARASRVPADDAPPLDDADGASREGLVTNHDSRETPHHTGHESRVMKS